VKGFFFLHPYVFLPASPQFLNPETDLDFLFEKGTVVTGNRNLGVCYRFNNPEANFA